MTTPTQNSGIIRNELNPAIRPQDDLYRHVSGRWLERTEIPADRARYGTFIQLHEAAEEAVRDIIEQAQHADPGSEERKIGDLYASFMDADRAEELGADPIRKFLGDAQQPETVSALLETIGRFERWGVSGFVLPFVNSDPGDPHRYLVFFEQGGIGLPDESYFRDDTFADVRTSYRRHIQRMFELAELDNAATRAERVFALETEIAAAHWDNVTCRDRTKTYNLVSWQTACDTLGGSEADLSHWLRGLGVDPRVVAELVLRQPSFLEGVGRLLTADRLEAWRDWLAWRVIRSFASYLSAEFVEESFAFYGRTLSGTPELRQRWKRGVGFVQGAMGMAVGHTYVAQHFPTTAKAQMDELVANLVAAYRDSISTLEWMGAQTRERALEKLAAFTPKIGYPTTWRDYASLQVDARDLVGNVQAATEFEFNRELAKIGQPIDRDEWFMTPQTVNAYYNPGMNEIVFPAAILQFPFFDADRDAAANYGAIGAVIGHEIGHGFDDQGSKFDGDGKLTDWWTKSDREAFEERTASLIGQYNTLAPAQVPEHFVNGKLTIGENIGDLGGLSIAWKAYLLSLDGAEPAVIDGMTAAQRFFLSWAQAWQSKARDEEAIRLLAIDPHSPAEFRCNQIVRNLDVFYDTFDVGEGDAMYLPPEERVTIW